MLALAWATLPDLPGYRTGIIIVGIARYLIIPSNPPTADQKVYSNGDDLEPIGTGQL